MYIYKIQFLQINNKISQKYQQSMIKENMNHICQSFSIEFQSYNTFQALLFKNIYPKESEVFAKKYDKELAKFIFFFRITYENYKWTLKRRFHELFVFYKILSKRYGKDIPDFPLQKEAEINMNNIDQLTRFMVIFLKKVINTAFYDVEVQHFFDILPQNIGYGVIYGEYPLKKLSGGRYNEMSCIKSLSHLICPCVRTWRTRFFTITDNGIFYSKQRKSFEVKDMLIFCSRFQILIGAEETGHQFGIIIISSIRKLKLKADNIIDFILFVISIREAISENITIKNQRYDSFASIREHCHTKFYADGQDYFKDIQIELKNAKKYVYITDWMITPYFMLIRQSTENEEESILKHRFDHVLEHIAQKGVKVYIILYQEPKMAINNDSEHVERYLQKLHPNIKVLRHPNYLVIPFLWSHHEKSLLIDQKVAFIGGLDICYGRWDNQSHSLTNESKKWYGADFCNLRLTDIYFPRNFMMCSIDAKNQPRMPWHDVAVQIRGNSVHDLARHFTTYWNFVILQSNFNDKELLTISGRKSGYFETRHKSISIRKESVESNKQRFLRQNQLPITAKHKLMPDKKTNLENISERSKSYVKMNRISKKRSTVDVPQMSIRKQSGSQLDQAADVLIEEQYYQKYLDEKVVKIGTIELPRMHTIKQNIMRMPKMLIGYIKDHQQQEILVIANQDDKQKEGKFRHQFVRSASTWSLGLMEKQQSIHEAYLNMISYAEHFIYIENQFFICKENLIVEKLAERIIRAHQEKSQFKVMILIPLLPGFQGDVREQKSAVMRVQLYWQFWTICRSNKSLYNRLKHIPNVQKYLYFFSLRQHGISDSGVSLTEILYIHSKLMIVDDKKLIIGSANINDRSLVGDRDSELAIIVQDSEQIETKYGYMVSKEIQQFRIKLCMEHFGIDDREGENFLNESFWDMIKVRARTNTLIYRELFGCYPDDTMTKYEDITKVQKKSRQDKYKELSKDILGHVVELPLKFLQKEDLNLSAKEKQYFLPRIFFT